MPQHYLLTTNYPSSTTSQGFYNPVTILSPTICCKFWPGRKKKTKNKKLAVWPCPWTQENRSGKGLRRSPAEHQQLNFEPRRSRKATLVCTILSNVCQGHQRATQLEYEGRAIEMTFKTNPTTPNVAFAAAIYHCTETYHYLAWWQQDFGKAIESTPPRSFHLSLPRSFPPDVPSLPPRAPSFVPRHLSDTSSRGAELSPSAALSLDALPNMLTLISSQGFKHTRKPHQGQHQRLGAVLLRSPLLSCAVPWGQEPICWVGSSRKWSNPSDVFSFFSLDTVSPLAFASSFRYFHQPSSWGCLSMLLSPQAGQPSACFSSDTA